MRAKYEKAKAYHDPSRYGGIKLSLPIKWDSSPEGWDEASEFVRFINSEITPEKFEYWKTNNREYAFEDLIQEPGIYLSTSSEDAIKCERVGVGGIGIIFGFYNEDDCEFISSPENWVTSARFSCTFKKVAS